MTNNNDTPTPEPENLQKLLDRYIGTLRKDGGFFDFLETKYCLEALAYFIDCRGITDARKVDKLTLRAYFAYLDGHCPSNNKTYCYKIKVHLKLTEAFFVWLLDHKHIEINPMEALYE